MVESLSPLSYQGRESLLSLTVVEEMIRADGWNSLDDCFEVGGDMLVDRYIGMADAAIHVCRSYWAACLEQKVLS